MGSLYIRLRQAGKVAGQAAAQLKVRKSRGHTDEVDPEASRALLASIGQTEANVCSFML